VAWLRGLGNPELQGAVLDEVAWGWSTQDRDGLMPFLAAGHGERASSSVYRNVMNSFAREDPVRALEWAASLAPERVAEVSGTAFSVGTHHQPAAALAWLMELPADDSRRDAMMTNYITNALWQPEAVAMQRLAELPPAARTEARAQLDRAGIPEEKREALRRALGE
jgi:hypothetical protein